jgi:hypothetical protein
VKGRETSSARPGRWFKHYNEDMIADFQNAREGFFCGAGLSEPSYFDFPAAIGKHWKGITNVSTGGPRWGGVLHRWQDDGADASLPVDRGDHPHRDYE